MLERVARRKKNLLFRCCTCRERSISVVRTKQCSEINAYTIGHHVTKIDNMFIDARISNTTENETNEEAGGV